MDLYKRFEEEVLSKPGKSPEYLIGIKYEKLTVVDFRYTKSGLTWICKCECGKIAYVRSKKHLEKRIACQSCTASIRSALKHSSIPHYGYKKRKYKEYKDGANKRHLDFELTESEFFNLITSPCVYCGKKPELKTSQYAVKADIEPLTSNGVDRLDSSKGYTVDNSVSCCSDCNYGKHRKSKQEFLEWVSRVYHFNNK